MKLQLEEALNLSDAMNGASQDRVLTAFRQSSARFDDIREAFVAAVPRKRYRLKCRRRIIGSR
jgi:hypothetical protein